MALGKINVIRANKSATKGSDEFCRTPIESTTSAEVLGWLDTEKASLGVMSHAESAPFAEEVYRLGMKSIIAVEITNYPDEESQNTGRICVELPDDPGSRTRVLAWAASIAEKQGFDGEEDVGQQCVFLMLD